MRRVKPIELELIPGAKPSVFNSKKPTSQVTKKEINKLLQLGVIEKPSDSEWACGTFIIRKKTLG